MENVTIWQNGKKTVVSCEKNQLLSEVLAMVGVYSEQPCGGRGFCGKCAVEASGEISPPNDAEKKSGCRLACQLRVLGEASIILPDRKIVEQIQDGILEIQKGVPMEGTLGAAVDIGTTTLAMQVYDLRTGERIGSATAPNPQIAVAADVMGRIGAAMVGQLDKLCEQISSALLELLIQACGTRAEEVDRLVITGNTTMLYLLIGRNPSCLSCAPFHADTLFDVDIKLLGRRTYIPGCMNAFVGADITSAVLSSGMCESSATSILCDVGTNGEIALWKDGVLYVTSTAAGPAFEGAGISCGCGSVRGAIDKVWAENGVLTVHTIGNEPAIGLCGSGLIDAVAALRELEILDETGAMDSDQVVLSGKVWLLQRDIRAVQLAKAAIAAGIETLLEEAGITYEDVETFYIAGGFGSHLNVQSAVGIGLFPAEWSEKVVVLGNAALSGAVQLMLNQEQLQQCRKITAVSQHCNLGGNPSFNERYMEQMFFPD